MAARNRILGADLALNHGAIVDQEGKILYTYTKGNGNRSTVTDLYERALDASKIVPYKSIVVVDWDRFIGDWNRRRKSITSILLTVINIQFGTICLLDRKSEVHYVTPKLVRECLGLAPKTAKLDVHKSVQFPLHIQNLKGELGGDIKDAYLLAKVYEDLNG